MSENLTFRNSRPSWANACVGDNGSPSYIDYAKGFSEAANLLINEVISCKSRKHSVDTLIYPICFNMRHAVELWLKGTVVVLQELAKFKNVNLDFNLSSSHDIGNIWNFIKVNAVDFDIRYSSFINKLDEYIEDISNIDSTGQTFRYPFDGESKKHLTEVSIINVCILKVRFAELEAILDELNYFNLYVEEEYSLGSYTRKLSRSELYNLANDLPDRSQWSNSEFLVIKQRTMSKYELSSNDFSKAINIIEDNYEMGRLISSVPSLKGICSNGLNDFFDEWVKVHDIERLTKPIDIEDRMIEFTKPDFESMENDGKVEAECCDTLLKKLCVEAVSGLKALFYFGEHKDFTEYYISMYERTKTEFSVTSEKDPDRYRQSLNHILNKTNAFENILMSLYFLGYGELSDQILKRYNVKGCFDWLEKAKNRSLFSKPDFCGYNL